ncbi:MAG: phosphopantetheine-binding protein [Solirubrobacteraceae bacterium]
MNDEPTVADTLLRFWKETLANDALTLDDDVMMLGATSVQIMSVIGRVAEELSIEVPVEALFDAITIGDQAEVLTGAGVS